MLCGGWCGCAWVEWVPIVCLSLCLSVAHVLLVGAERDAGGVGEGGQGGVGGKQVGRREGGGCVVVAVVLLGSRGGASMCLCLRVVCGRTCFARWR